MRSLVRYSWKLPTKSATTSWETIHVPGSLNAGILDWPVQVPLRLLPDVRVIGPNALCWPEGLTKYKYTSFVPERSSVTWAVRFTVAELVVVFTDVGMNVKLVSNGGCVSDASGGSAAMTASSSRNKVLTEFRAKLLPRADMRLPPAARLLVIKSCVQRRLRREPPAAG